MPFLPQNRATRAIWFWFAAQPRASFDALRAHPGRDPAQGWVKPISTGWLQALLGWANTLFLQVKSKAMPGQNDRTSDLQRSLQTSAVSGFCEKRKSSPVEHLHTWYGDPHAPGASGECFAPGNTQPFQHSWAGSSGKLEDKDIGGAGCL